jgi:putative transposase
MFGPVRLWAGVLVPLFHSRQILLIENLALRQQLAVFKRQCRRPRLSMLDELFWVLVYRCCSSWKKTLIVVSPDTVVRWHRAGFRLYWRLISRVRKPVGRKPVSKEIRELIFKMVAENPTWRAPRIHGELVMLGFEISARSVSRWMRRAPRSPDSAQRWLTFLRNHREAIAAIAAMDFFSVPTVTFGVLYVFFVIGHDRRRILHFNVTRHPTSTWIVQQLRDAFPANPQPSFSSRIHDSKYGSEIPAAIRAMDIKAVRTTVGWSLAERCCRALGGELPPRTVGPCGCGKRDPSEAAARLLCRLLPRGSYPLWTPEADPEKANALRRTRENHSVAACRRSSSSLRARRLNWSLPWFLPG